MALYITYTFTIIIRYVACLDRWWSRSILAQSKVYHNILSQLDLQQQLSEAQLVYVLHKSIRTWDLHEKISKRACCPQRAPRWWSSNKQNNIHGCLEIWNVSLVFNRISQFFPALTCEIPRSTLELQSSIFPHIQVLFSILSNFAAS